MGFVAGAICSKSTGDAGAKSTILRGWKPGTLFPLSALLLPHPTPPSHRPCSAEGKPFHLPYKKFPRRRLGILTLLFPAYSPRLLAPGPEPEPRLLDLATAVPRLQAIGWIMDGPYHVLFII